MRLPDIRRGCSRRVSHARADLRTALKLLAIISRRAFQTGRENLATTFAKKSSGVAAKATPNLKPNAVLGAVSDVMFIIVW